MNDFTKEELIELLDICKAAYVYGEINPQTPSRVKQKIQTMINNYCEHGGKIGKDYPAEKCMQCGVMWE
jgi:hypothetical protein